MLCIKSLILITASCSQQAYFAPVHSTLQFQEPVQVLFDGVHDEFMYVVEKKGVIRRASMSYDETKKPEYLNIEDRVGVTYDEEGLLSVVFHPDFKENGKLFVWYSAQRPKRTVLASFTTSDPNSSTIDPTSEVIILQVSQPWVNHNGGTILFGPDGYLYLSIGDGGAANDPQKNGQNRNTLLGSIIRIDVDHPTNQRAYSIPKDNPLVGEEHVREELWAWGLRNVWRMSFDKKTGNLWASDVGQNAWEEIDIIVKGGNYGWNIREGFHAFQSSESTTTMIDPVYEYGRSTGRSITGGFVYRGKKISKYIGAYLYCDYMSERTWVLLPPKKEGDVYTSMRIAETTPLAISSFGETPTNEILACGFENPYGSIGKIYLLTKREISLKPKDILD